MKKIKRQTKKSKARKVSDTSREHRRDTAIIMEDVEFIKGSVKAKVDIDEFAALERRVALLEKRL